MKVSLYVPCYNAEETIRYCLESVLKQRCPLEEILVIDDGSTDDTANIASKYPVRIIKHDCNRGLAAARNTAIKNARTKFIASIDSDCSVDAEWLSYLTKRLKSAKTAGVGGKLLETYSSSVFDIWRNIHMKQYWELKEKTPPFIFGSNTIFNREAIARIGYYDESFKKNFEDVDISERFKKAGYSLIFEPKAIAHHLRSDNLCSVLDAYWNWNFSYYLKKGFYSNAERFNSKIKDNIGLANRYIEEDISGNRLQLLYLDFLLALHHSLRDFEYFISQDNHTEYDLSHPQMSLWLSLLDLSFSFHFNYKNNKFYSMLPKRNAFLLNFLIFNLIFEKILNSKFRNADSPNKNFQAKVYKHLLFSIFKIEDSFLVERILMLADSHQDWEKLIEKGYPNLNEDFLVNIFSSLFNWLDELTYRFHNIIELIEISAEKTDKFVVFRNKEEL